MRNWLHGRAIGTHEAMDDRVGSAGEVSCPVCRSTRLVAVGDGAGTNFRCENCMRCWHETLGWRELIDPRSCIDCPQKLECIAAVANRGVENRELGTGS